MDLRPIVKDEARPEPAGGTSSGIEMMAGGTRAHVGEPLMTVPPHPRIKLMPLGKKILVLEGMRGMLLGKRQVLKVRFKLPLLLNLERLMPREIRRRTKKKQIPGLNRARM